MTSLQGVEWEACLVEPRRDAELEREVRKSLGIVPPAIPFLTACPWLVRALARGNFRNGKLVHIDVGLAELVFLAVSQDNSCRYCYASQRAALRIQGFDEERIRKVEEASSTVEADRAEHAALDFARRISRSNPAPSAADKRALAEVGYEDGAIAEIAYVAASTLFSNQVTTLPAVPTEGVEGFEERWFVRLLRPILARGIRSRQRRGEADFLPPELETGPYSYVHRELDGLPFARISRETFEEAWRSPLLGERAKALVFAVVARALGSEAAEAEARGLLGPLGLEAGEVDEVLSTLASPRLDPIEAAIVPFARETDRYRPADIQRRARRLREQLGPERFLELVGVTALANSTCRLSLVLCEARSSPAA